MNKERSFIGEYRYSLDDKGRTMFPAHYRTDADAPYVLTKGMDRCLYLFDDRVWTSIIERFYGDLIPVSSDTRAFVRVLFSGAATVELDKVGRIFIPQHLREYAQLDKEVVFAGALTHLEIWDVRTWESYRAKAEKVFEQNIGALQAK
ncbi:MAG: division/cell wall cluster transcriptional repressor MraZ [Candidatus Cryosericum sp.]|jgi:MraZ protein|nr:division/cell wall cluster transcriptional repressor MraZ [Candidatus Cryosericum sp.]HOV50399.1 division/cell wall cluster transcriptional repressor MraZ [Candidatus Cryosericum sp.]HPS69618.1 division/cell wall cluster transcriptional repressor MraZ [Candidatus Cryosericum sp.]